MQGKTKQIRLVKRSAMYWRATFDHAPLNIFGPEAIPQLNEIVTALETDKSLKVVVFDSAVEGFFLTHYDFLSKLEDPTSLPPGPTQLALASDMRFASRAKAVPSQWEVGAGLVPGGGPMARLPRLMGRGRALHGFVEALATRIATFDKDAIRETKPLVDVASLPPDVEIAQERIGKPMKQGFHKPGDVETRLGHYAGQLGRLAAV